MLTYARLPAAAHGDRERLVDTPDGLRPGRCIGADDRDGVAVVIATSRLLRLMAMPPDRTALHRILTTAEPGAVPNEDLGIFCSLERPPGCS